MKLVNFFLILCLCNSAILGRRIKIRTKDHKPILYVADANGMTTDSEQSQYFDKSNKHLYLDMAQLPSTVSNQYPTIKALMDKVSKSLDYNSSPADDLTIARIKLYSREVFPDYMSAVITTVTDYLAYFTGWKSPKGIHHEFLVLCAQKEKGSHSYFFVIDRTADGRASSFSLTDYANSNVLASMIRVIYTGEEKKHGCGDESAQWPETKSKISGSKEVLSEKIADKTLTDESKTMNSLIKASIKYLEKWKSYFLNTVNCQHYATGMFNALTGEKNVYKNADMMSTREQDKDLSKLFG